MIIECEICASCAEMDKPPLNNICPVCLHIGSLFIQEKPTEEQLEALKELKRETTISNEKIPPDFDENDMTKMFMNVDKLEEIPVDSIFDLLTEKENARARRKGKRIGEFFNFIHKIKRFFKRGVNNA